MMEAAELRKQDESELQKNLTGLLTEHFKLRMLHATGQLSKNSKLKDVRRNIARMKTIIHEKQKLAQVGQSNG